MALHPGTRLGPYEITAEIGAGGMGVVYRARDTRLQRNVAIKVLPDTLAADPDRLARFQREAQVLASLNHPNIAAIYGLEKQPEVVSGFSRTVHALVLELVDGETLADRIARGPIPVDDALAIAKQIAEAIETAHEQGIIHRDLKPANIKTRTDGTVKVLDFGLAKALSPPALDDARTSVLYEMLTGKRAFEDEDVSLTLSKVLQREPDFDALPADTPSRVRNVLRLCLQKPLRERMSDMGAVRLALEGAFETAAPRAGDRFVAPVLKAWQRPLPAGLMATTVAAVSGLAVWSGFNEPILIR